jgi:hypothetical protein
VTRSVDYRGAARLGCLLRSGNGRRGSRVARLGRLPRPPSNVLVGLTVIADLVVRQGVLGGFWTTIIGYDPDSGSRNSLPPRLPLIVARSVGAALRWIC